MRERVSGDHFPCIHAFLVPKALQMEADSNRAGLGHEKRSLKTPDSNRPRLKGSPEAVLHAIGLDATTAVRLFFTKVARTRSIPFQRSVFKRRLPNSTANGGHRASDFEVIGKRVVLGFVGDGVPDGGGDLRIVSSQGGREVDFPVAAEAGAEFAVGC